MSMESHEFKDTTACLDYLIHFDDGCSAIALGSLSSDIWPGKEKSAENIDISRRCTRDKRTTSLIFAG